MALPDTKAAMTAEKVVENLRTGYCYHRSQSATASYCTQLSCSLCVTAAIREAVEAERDRWMQATEHEHTCEYVQSPQTLCTCGAHVQLALLHGEAAYAIRARKASHDS